MKLAKTAKKSAKGATKAVKRKARRGPSTRERVAKIAGAVGITAAAGFLLAKLGGRKAAGKAKGAVQGVASTVTGGKHYDDVTLARQVETELFRPASVPKGAISVNVTWPFSSSNTARSVT